jgi:hypothetical protein
MRTGPLVISAAPNSAATLSAFMTRFVKASDSTSQGLSGFASRPTNTLPTMSGGLGVLSMAWVAVEASLPLGWRLMALVRQPDSDDWLATAAGLLDAQTAHGRGGQAERALRRLAEELRRIKGPMTG